MVFLCEDGDKGDSYLAFARDFEDIGAVGVYTPWQAENKLSNTYFLTSFLVMCLINSHRYERISTLWKNATGEKKKKGQLRCLMYKYWTYDQQLHWTTNLYFAFQAEHESQIFMQIPNPTCVRTDKEEQPPSPPTSPACSTSDRHEGEPPPHVSQPTPSN